MYTCLEEKKKGEEKVDTIHLLSQCCFEENRVSKNSLYVEFYEFGNENWKSCLS